MLLGSVRISTARSAVAETRRSCIVRTVCPSALTSVAVTGCAGSVAMVNVAGVPR